MDPLPSEHETLSRLVQWAKSQPPVRAMLLTSTRAVPNGQSDIFSDYDVVLALSDVRPFAADRLWLEAFGSVLVMYQDPLESDAGHLHSGNVVQFESGLKIDFTLLDTQYFRSIGVENSAAIETQNVASHRKELDAGYRILLDKDGLTDGFKPPTYQAYIPSPPNEALYLDMIEGGFLDATYVAKYLRRGDLMAARFIQTTFLKDEHLRPLLEWHYEIDHGWKVKSGLHGRHMQQYLRPDLLADLEGTYAGPGLEENWEALFRILALLCKDAREVGEHLGFAFPEEMVRRAMAYLQKIKEREK